MTKAAKLSQTGKKDVLTSLLLLVMAFSVSHSGRSQTAVITQSPTSVAAFTSDKPKIRLRLMQTVSSANAKAGESIVLESVDAVIESGRVIVAKGASAAGEVTIARRRGHNHREGKLLLTMKSVRLADGAEARLEATPLAKGTGKGAGIFGPCTFPLPADPVGLFRKGANVVIPAGTEIDASIAPEVH